MPFENDMAARKLNKNQWLAEMVPNYLPVLSTESLLCRMAVDRELRLSTITKTSPCNKDPLTPHFYIVKLGFTGACIIFFILLLNIDCGYSLERVPTIYVLTKNKKNITIFI